MSLVTKPNFKFDSVKPTTMSIDAIEMKPCENKQNHESILNRRWNNGDAADNSRYTSFIFSLRRLLSIKRK